jgi:hypothetical protein
MTHASPSGPPAGPPPGPPAGPNRVLEWLDRLGWRGRRRAQPLLGHAIGAGGGALVAVGVIVLGIDSAEDDGSGGVGALLSVLLVVVALVVMLRTPGPVRSGCVAAVVIGAPSLWFFAITVESSSGSLTAFYLLSVASLTALYLLGPTRGRAVLLGVALLFVWGWIAGEVAGTNELGEIQTESSTSFDEDFEEEEEFPESGAETDAGVVSLVIGAAYLAGAWWLDRQQRQGVATPFVVGGIVAAVTGAIIVGVDAGAIGGGILAVVVGLGIGYVGAVGRDRRASTWLGALTATVGVTVVVGDIVDPDDSAVAFAVFVMLVGAGIVVGAAFLSRLLGEPDDEEAVAPAS